MISLYTQAYTVTLRHFNYTHCRIRFGVLTLDEVNSSMVDRSSTCRAAAIWDRRRSSFRSFCRSPVKWASSTISVPKWLKALTNSVKLLTPSSRPRLRDTFIKCKNKNVSGLNILVAIYCYYIPNNLRNAYWLSIRFLPYPKLLQWFVWFLIPVYYSYIATYTYNNCIHIVGIKYILFLKKNVFICIRYSIKMKWLLSTILPT